MAESRRNCASCGAPNEEDARFCESCGASLARICATCGVEASATARFCRGCGAPLGQSTGVLDTPDAGPVRKTVTVMFADLAGSTSFEERVDAETAREVIGRYHDLLRRVAQRHRAGVTKYIGDGFMAVWGVPEVGPEDAVRAVDAAVELQERFVGLATRVTENHGVELALRVAVNTGEVVVGAGDADLVGDALNVCARLESECPRGQVVVGEETWRATRGHYGYESLGELQVKGRSAPVAVYQWLGRQSESADAAPFVGRLAELQRLQTAMDGAIAERTARLVTVVGDPGVGKSRLAAQFAGAQTEARVIEARCDLEGTVAMAPLIEVLRATDLESDISVSVSERDRLLRDLGGLATGEAGSVEENFWALRRFLEVLSTERPVVLVLDDIQWADTLLLDFIEHIVEWTADVPVLVLALARPELRELRPELVTVGRFVSEAIHLSGLDPSATAELAANVLGAAQLPDELLRRLPSSTGGNPLFVRELVGMLAHDGVLIEEDRGWRLTIDVDAIAVPPTIHALLASRLERLDMADRRVLELASVVGSEFSIGAVRALADGSETGVTLSLNRLRRLDLAQPSGAYVGDEPVWRFHHVLIRDVAYRRLLKSDRADLHERLAGWVESGGSSVAFDSDEMIARHLESAYSYRSQLGALDDHSRKMAVRSARHYAASARRALDRDELVSAGTQAARGAALAADDEALHADLLLIGCEAFLSAGDVAAGAPLVDELERIADDSLAPWATCYRCQFVVYTDPERLLEVETRLHEAIDEFGRRTDHAGLAKAHRVRAGARARLGRIGDSEIDLFEALIAARQSGDHRQITAALGAAPGAALWGPSPVPKAGGRCLDVVRMQRMTTAAPSLEATSLRHLAVLELLRGRPDKARTMLSNARQVVADLGLRHGLMETELFAGLIESMEGDAAAAEPHFRTALDGFKALGVGADAGQAAALLARMILAQGRIDEADRYAAESERLAGRNLKTAIAWRAVRAEILAAQGRHEEAATLARDAVAVAAGTDLVLDHAEACLALRLVLDVAGDIKGANAARSNAEALYTAKDVSARIGRVPVSPVEPAAKAPVSSRFTITNRATEVGRLVAQALHDRDVDAAISAYSDKFVNDDRRRISGDPIDSLPQARTAIERILEQYSHFDSDMLAVRGERLALANTRVTDDSGNEATGLIVFEVDDDGRIVYQGRFDDDFESAYRELDRRYYAAEGAAFADAAYTSTESIIALNKGDFDRLFGELSTPEMRVENRSRSAFGHRSADDLRASFRELNAMVISSRTWLSVVHWLSPRWNVSRVDRDAIGEDGQRYTWTRLMVFDVHDGLIASMCQFEPGDEDAALAYAEERVRATTSRLAIANRATATSDALGRASNASDVDAAVACYADSFVFDDRRRISGDPIHGTAELRVATERLFANYQHYRWRTLAVRGDRIDLNWSEGWDEDGNASAHLHVREIGDDGRFVYDGRFDEDNFEGAYRELERRYYAGEGAALAASGDVVTECISAVNHDDFDRLFGELSTPDLRFEQHSRSALPNRSAADLRASFDNFTEMVASSQSWLAAVSWVSPEWLVSRFGCTAVGLNNEQFAWTRILVICVRDGRLGALYQFEMEDESAAFAHAEERARANGSRLVVKNLASATFDVVCRGMRDHDADGAVRAYSESFVYDDHRHISGGPVRGIKAMRAGIALVCEQYPRLEWRTLAVRGELLELRWACQSDYAGNETTSLMVIEVDRYGLIIYQGRFDEDDFEGAYRELDRRYYAGEGAEFAEGGSTLTNYVIALNRGDLGQAFEELATPDAYIENRSRSVFGDRSTAEFRESIEKLSSMVSSARTWHSTVQWLSPAWVVVRAEREAVGEDGERYSWMRAYVIEMRDGRAASLCEFEIDDEDAAFAYAEERMQHTTSRLVVANAASAATDAAYSALRAHDVDGTMAAFSCRLEYDDRRRLSGNPIADIETYRAAVALAVQQYGRFDWRILAVRGQRLALVSTRMSSDAGFQATYLHLIEVDDAGLIVYEGRFDEDDFEGAYRELDRRYFTAEGAEFAEAGETVTEWTVGLNRGDFDRLFDDLTAGDFRIENRSRSAFPDRSASEYRKTLEELVAMVFSARAWISVMSWVSPNYCVVRCERDAVGEAGDHYTWHFLITFEIRGGRVCSMCEFEVDDEDAAFAYAEDRARASASRLRISNRASTIARAAAQALQAHDVDALRVDPSPNFVYDDRRRISGHPINGAEELQAATERILQSYPHTEWRTMAVRGERLEMHSSRLWDDDGNEATTLNVMEFDDAGRLEYFGRFEEDDFEGAYRELDRRYYADEGAAFAEAGALATEWIVALNRGDYAKAFGELSDPDAGYENRSRSAFPDPSVSDAAASYEDLNAMVGAMQTWPSAFRWLTPKLVVSRLDREAIGRDGERYTWTWILVSQLRNGRFGFGCLFDLEDEDAAFAYAEERMQSHRPRLAVTNRADRTAQAYWAAMRRHDVDGVLECCAEGIAYDDRRRITGDAIPDRTALRAEFSRIFAQYTEFEARTLALRGEHLMLGWSRWSNDAGFQTAYLHVVQTRDDGRIVYEGRFDEDDFDGASRVLDNRYYAGEGAPFAKNGLPASEAPRAMSRGDFDMLFRELASENLRVETRSRRAFPDRTAKDLRAGFEELNTMVTSTRTWNSVVAWLSPNCSVTRLEREATGADGETYQWSMILVTEHRDGLVTLICEFDPDDEASAFACAEELVQAQSRRLALTNPARETAFGILDAGRAKDVDTMSAAYADAFVYDDRRHISGDPIRDRATLRRVQEQIVQQYSNFDGRTLAVRGERLHLGWGRWSSDSGFETTHLYLHEVDGGGRIVYEGRFDEDDFDGAYRELEERYYRGEGAEFAAGGLTTTDYAISANRGDLDRVFGQLTAPGFCVENRSRSGFPDRSADEFRASLNELDNMVASVRTWSSAICWLSPTWSVARQEREAVGKGGEHFSWTRLMASEVVDGQVKLIAEFEPDDEDAAFAYAEEKVRANPSRLAVTNRAKRTWDSVDRAGQARDLDALATFYSKSLVYEDRRRLSGGQIEDMRTAFERVAQDYTQLEMRSLAVRGERLHLGYGLYRNDSGFESSSLWVHEVDDEGIIVYLCRFDEDDFESAYRKLDERYYAGEGAAFAEAGATPTEVVIALNRGDFDKVFDELAVPGAPVENRSRLPFPDRTADVLRASFADLETMVTSTRTWFSAMCWVSNVWNIVRFEREAVGADGEQYAWAHLVALEVRDGRIASMCEFEIDDEEAAFTYAEEQAMATATRLALTNSATRRLDALMQAGRARDADAMADCYIGGFVYDDRRKLSGNPISDLRATAERILSQYNRFEARSLAVRGEHLQLAQCRWSNDSGFETTHLIVNETGHDGRFVFEARFDEDDFENAYRELERRYCSGEGAEFAEIAMLGAEYLIAINQGAFDKVVDDLTAPGMRIENRTRSGFPDRSVTELGASFEELNTMVGPSRSWNSAVCWLSPACGVVRHEREAFREDSEHYAWAFIVVFEAVDGRATHLCQFEPDDEAAAFAYAEERVRQAQQR